jgi:hypothetical protein
MLDKLVITCDRSPDMGYLEGNYGVDETENRKKFYKYSSELDRAIVQWKPHRFSRETNDRYNFTRISLNPKFFGGYDELVGYVKEIFGQGGVPVSPDELHVTRLDVASDLRGVAVHEVLGAINLRKVKLDSFQVYKGTIYAGRDPKVVIYDKLQEIIDRQKRGKAVTSAERDLVRQGECVTRFEVRKVIKSLHLGAVIENIESFADYFDRIDFFGDGCESPCHMLQAFTSKLHRKHRKVLDEFRTGDLMAKLKSGFLQGAREWVAGVPF